MMSEFLVYPRFLRFGFHLPHSFFSKAIDLKRGISSSSISKFFCDGGSNIKSGSTFAENNILNVQNAPSPPFRKLLIEIDDKLKRNIKKKFQIWTDIDVVEDIEYEDTIRKLHLSGKTDVRKALYKLNAYYRTKSAYTSFKRIGSIIDTKENSISLLWTLRFLETNIFSAIISLIQGKIEEDTKEISGTLQIYINLSGAVYRVINRDTSAHEKELFRKMWEQQNAEEEKRSTFNQFLK